MGCGKQSGWTERIDSERGLEFWGSVGKAGAHSAHKGRAKSVWSGRMRPPDALHASGVLRRLTRSKMRPVDESPTTPHSLAMDGEAWCRFQ